MSGNDVIPLNRPESGGTVPISTTLSRCPAEHSACPEFIGRRSVRFFRLEQQLAHTRRQDTHALFCCHAYMSSGDSLFSTLLYRQEVRNLPPPEERARSTHTERMFSVASSAHSHIHYQSKRIEHPPKQ